MFLCAVVRPRFNTSANCWWDGKLGIWPIGDWEPAQRGSKNRPKGTLVWKNKTVTKVVYRDLLMNKLILAILDKWLRRDRMSRTIYIQQDGAKNHIREDDEKFNNALTEQEIVAKLYTQMPNSPDVNLLDLGFFQAIQSFNDASPKNEAELIQLVQDAYKNYLRHKLNWMWPTLQVASIRLFYIMETMTTVLNTSRKQNWNGRGNRQTYWMWWMMTCTK